MINQTNSRLNVLLYFPVRNLLKYSQNRIFFLKHITSPENMMKENDKYILAYFSFHFINSCIHRIKISESNVFLITRFLCVQYLREMSIFTSSLRSFVRQKRV